MKILRSAFINISLAILVFYLVSTFKERNLLQTNNAPAPYFNLPLLNQPTERISIAQLEGKTTVVYFFAPWCAICRYSMPNLEAVLESSNINAIGIALDYRSPQEASNVVADLNLTMPILLDERCTQSNYKISVLPTYYIINEPLQITARSVGYSSGLGIK
ncbi:heme-binding protein [Pseudoalteromonas aliena]|uniref:Heme-binding protein n=1 Tax=Pseudoalteromonas aliena TaxID=247523 RepID=A0A1Q2H345_9GAMM|nr:TlpA disulfide reductase family protein [Pseudoalteromonas aliena]AQQ01780.1 heme-binding protein [Pseudoalteromonas aliena]